VLVIRLRYDSYASLPDIDVHSVVATENNPWRIINYVHKDILLFRAGRCLDGVGLVKFKVDDSICASPRREKQTWC
jgi:hypothetical protein